MKRLALLAFALLLPLTSHAEGGGDWVTLTCKAFTTAGAEIELPDSLAKGLKTHYDYFSDAGGIDIVEIGDMTMKRTLATGYNASVGILVLKISKTKISMAIEDKSSKLITPTVSTANGPDVFEPRILKVTTKDARVKCILQGGGAG